MPSEDLSRREVLTTVTIAGAAAALPGCTHSSKEERSATTAIGRTDPAPPAGTVPVTLNINGKDHTLNLEPRVTLLDALREHLNLTGTKKGCDHGQCGACTLLLDNKRVDSCLILAVMAQGKQIT